MRQQNQRVTGLRARVVRPGNADEEKPVDVTVEHFGLTLAAG